MANKLTPITERERRLIALVKAQRDCIADLTVALAKCQQLIADHDSVARDVRRAEEQAKLAIQQVDDILAQTDLEEERPTRH